MDADDSGQQVGRRVTELWFRPGRRPQEMLRRWTSSRTSPVTWWRHRLSGDPIGRAFFRVFHRVVVHTRRRWSWNGFPTLALWIFTEFDSATTSWKWWIVYLVFFFLFLRPWLTPAKGTNCFTEFLLTSFYFGWLGGGAGKQWPVGDSPPTDNEGGGLPRANQSIPYYRYLTASRLDPQKRPSYPNDPDHSFQFQFSMFSSFFFWLENVSIRTSDFVSDDVSNINRHQVPTQRKNWPSYIMKPG